MKPRFDGAPVALFAMSLLMLGGCTLFGGNHEKYANALETPVAGGQAQGSVSFVEFSGGVQVNYNFTGLPPDSEHALQVHERGDCNAGDGTDAGAVFSPAADRLNGLRPAGDFGNIRADATGVATGFLVTRDISLDGVRSVVGRAVLLHRDASDPEFPQHGAGPALACGTIRQ